MVKNQDMSGVENLDYKDEDQDWYAPNFPETQEITQKQWAPLQAEIDVVIITATDIELKAVGRLLKPYPRRKKVLLVYSKSETYYLGKFGEYKTVVTKCEMGAIGRGAAIDATGVAIDLWSPKAVIMVGIAFGKNSETQKIGDVLVASKIITYEQQKVEDGGKITHRGDIPPSDKTLLNRFKNSQNWSFTLPDNSSSKLIYGAFLSGEKLSRSQEFKDNLFGTFPQAVGGEMEGAGLYAAADSRSTAWILVKSICDWGDKEKNDKYQTLAAAAATSLVHHVLSQKTVLDDFGKKKQFETLKIPQPQKSLYRKVELPLDEKLKMALCKLNHSEQVSTISYLLKLNNVVGVKIATSSINKSSHVWLLRCLMKHCLISNHDDYDINLVHLHLDTYSSEDLKEVWSQIANGLALPKCPPGTTVDKIISKICKKLQTEQDIILLFHRVDDRDKLYLEQILNNFWKPLIAEVARSKIKYRLFMCWIDYQNPANWREAIKFIDNYKEIVNESIFNLCVTNKFKKDDLKGWVNSPDILPVISELTKSNLIEPKNITAITEQIWRESDKGKPILLLQAIYNICNLPWEEYKSKWERL